MTQCVPRLQLMVAMCLRAGISYCCL